MIVDAKPYEYTFDPEKTALLVIDMQRDFCEHGASERCLAMTFLR